MSADMSDTEGRLTATLALTQDRSLKDLRAEFAAVDKLFDAMFTPKPDYRYRIVRWNGTEELAQPIEGEVYDWDSGCDVYPVTYCGRDMFVERDSTDEFDIPRGSLLTVANCQTEHAHEKREKSK